MKKLFILGLVLMFSLSFFVGCNDAVVDPGDNHDDHVDVESIYDDGSYRGVYVDRDGIQITIQFTLENDTFTDVSFRHLAYDGSNYLEFEESHVLSGVVSQYEQVVNYLVGKTIESVDDLYTPENIVDDVDAFAGATLRANKVVSSIRDALNRGVYSPAGEVTIRDFGQLTDGTYRGAYIDRDGIQVVVQFTLENNTFSSLSFRQLEYAGDNYRVKGDDDALYPIVIQHQQALDYLEGKPVEAVYELYNTADMVDDIDAFAGATIRGNKIVSSIIDGINRGVYNPSSDTIMQVDTPADGRYRGIYIDRDEIQVVVQFNIEDGMFTDLRFRQLAYSGQDYRGLEEGDNFYPVLSQHQQLIDYLVGKPFEAVYDLHNPGSFIEDVDTFAGATVRTNKVFSSIIDGINRGRY